MASAVSSDTKRVLLDGQVATDLSKFDVSAFIWKPYNVADLVDAIVSATGESTPGEAPMPAPSTPSDSLP